MIDPILTLQPEKYRVILPFADVIPRMTWLVGITTREFARKNPDLLRKLIAIRRRGVDFIYQNRDEAMRIYAKVWQQDPKQVATYFPKYFEYEGEWTRGEFEKAGLAKMSEGLELAGEVEKPVDWNAMIDQEFLPKDCEAAGSARPRSLCAAEQQAEHKNKLHFTKVGMTRTGVVAGALFALEILCRIGIIPRVTMDSADRNGRGIVASPP